MEKMRNNPWMKAAFGHDRQIGMRTDRYFPQLAVIGLRVLYPLYGLFTTTFLWIFFFPTEAICGCVTDKKGGTKTAFD